MAVHCRHGRRGGVLWLGLEQACLDVSQARKGNASQPPLPQLADSSYRYKVLPTGRIGPQELFAFASPGIPDGVHCDTKGNVYAGVGDGVHVWNSEGTLLGKIYVGATVANFQVSMGVGLGESVKIVARGKSSSRVCPRLFFRGVAAAPRGVKVGRL
jgi:hypothetical protein